MKATVSTLAVVLAITLGAAATQATQTTQPTQTQTQTQTQTTQKQPPEVILTGCVIQGSSPTVFLFENARKDANSTTEKGMKYLIASTIEDIDLRSHLNHQVRIVAEVDAVVSADPVTVPPVPPTPPSPTDQEKALPKLKAKSVTMVSDTCATVR
jgi:hypothetical protein